MTKASSSKKGKGKGKVKLSEVKKAVHHAYELSMRYSRENPNRAVFLWAAVEGERNEVSGTLLARLSVSEMAQHLASQSALEDLIAQALKLRYAGLQTAKQNARRQQLSSGTSGPTSDVAYG